MTRTARRASASTAACAALVACATAGDPGLREASGAPVAPYESHEACVALAAGERLDWSFSADTPVAFDIRYVEGNATLIPLSRDASSGDAGVFRAVLDRAYCAVWEAGPSGARITYRLRRLGEAK